MPWKPQTFKARYPSPRPEDRGPGRRRDPRSTPRWHALRQMMLRQHPTCMDPYGHHAQDNIVVVATQVDHVLGVRVRPDLVYAVENLQSLCTLCHAKKSASERQAESH